MVPLPSMVVTLSGFVHPFMGSQKVSSGRQGWKVILALALLFPHGIGSGGNVKFGSIKGGICSNEHIFVLLSTLMVWVHKGGCEGEFEAGENRMALCKKIRKM